MCDRHVYEAALLHTGLHLILTFNLFSRICLPPTAPYWASYGKLQSLTRNCRDCQQQEKERNQQEKERTELLIFKCLVNSKRWYVIILKSLTQEKERNHIEMLSQQQEEERTQSH